jgi:allantoate deiminase
MISAMLDARTVLQRCEAVARCSEEPGRVTRRFATPALAQARELVAGWMREAGLEPRRDAVGNLIGRREGPGRTLLLGSHLDSVRDGGRYDGALGVAVAVAAAARLRDSPLPFALEVAAFADEEGARFGTAFLGSSLLAGHFEADWLRCRDEDGVELADALRAWGGDPAAAGASSACGVSGASGRDDLLGYYEVHIEQGPVLDDADLAVGVVAGIAGQTRASVTFSGTAAHAGTTPIARRADALAAAAEWIGAVESAGAATDGLVATVGEISAEPGAANVVPGRAVASLDVRHLDDELRDSAVQALRAEAVASGAARGVAVDWREVHSTATLECDDRLTARLEEVAAAVTGARPPRLYSGAGHDGVMLATVAPIAMLFVRCAGGISHHPAESVREQDVGVALEVTTRLLEELAR